MPRTRDADRTVHALLEAARLEFATEGYASARTEAIVARAGVTRGALYHHFRDKLHLFTAVVEGLQADIAAEVSRAAVREPTPYRAMRAGFGRYLDCCVRDDIRRIVLIDGPSALGWETWQEIDERTAFVATRRAVRASVDAGELPDIAEEPLTRALLGLVTHVGLDIGRSPSPKRRRAELGAVVDVILRRLATEHTQSMFDTNG